MAKAAANRTVSNDSRLLWAFVLLSSLFLRCVIGLNGFSGKGVPPLHGDFEAQRHWLEITNGLPISEWYRYDSTYWPLDYPPLTAFHSLLLGKIAKFLDPSWIALDVSRGNESPGLILFMRWTVIATEFLVLAPGVVMLCEMVSKSYHRMNKVLTIYPQEFLMTAKLIEIHDEQHALALLLLCQPGLLIIDHGHFQYNAAMIGFTLNAVVFMMKERYLLGSVMFVCALCFKQMSLFYSLAFFFYLLGVCYHRGVKKGLLLLVQIGVIVMLTFALHLLPFADSVDNVLQIFKRVFPFHRGLWEDKVANVWCSLNVVVKLRTLYSIPTLAKLSAGTTLLSIVPIHFYLLKAPSIRRFMYALFTCSLSFFLFSFQVHEKSILIPALPCLLLGVLCGEAELCWLFQNVALFSMYPLLVRDGCVLGYVVCFIVWNLVCCFVFPTPSKNWRLLFAATTCIMAAIHLPECTIHPPKRYPDLWIVLNNLFSCVFFVGCLAYSFFRQVAFNDDKTKME